jgi:hypothetical protein
MTQTTQSRAGRYILESQSYRKKRFRVFIPKTPKFLTLYGKKSSQNEKSRQKFSTADLYIKLGIKESNSDITSDPASTTPHNGRKWHYTIFDPAKKFRTSKRLKIGGKWLQNTNSK